MRRIGGILKIERNVKFSKRIWRACDILYKLNFRWMKLSTIFACLRITLGRLESRFCPFKT